MSHAALSAAWLVYILKEINKYFNLLFVVRYTDKQYEYLHPKLKKLKIIKLKVGWKANIIFFPQFSIPTSPLYVFLSSFRSLRFEIK